MSNYTTVQGTRHPSQTLHEIAALLGKLPPLLGRLADDLEAQHTRQNNNTGAVLGNIELGIANTIDDLTARVAAVEGLVKGLSEQLRGVNGAGG
jgi:hypothetical protein